MKINPVETDTGIYLECEDERALGMESCGCDESWLREVKPFRYGLVHGLVVSWTHPGGRACIVALREDKSGEWIPMTYEQWQTVKQEAADG